MSEGSSSHGGDLEKPVFKNCTTPWEKPPTKKKHPLSFVGILLPTFCFVLFCLIQAELGAD